MTGLWAFLSGKKTYIIAFIAAATAGAQAMGYDIPQWVYAVEAALGLGTTRIAISNAGQPYQAPKN